MHIYDCGTQSDMNIAAWCAATPIDFRQIEAYKKLETLYGDATIVPFVHDDYMHTLTIFKVYCSSTDEWHSDLQHEQGFLFQQLLDDKLEYIESLVNKYQKGSINKNTVENKLKEHRILFGGREKQLTIDLWNDL